MLMAAVVTLYWFGRQTVDRLAALFSQTFSQEVTGHVSTDIAVANASAMAIRLGWIILPLMLAMFAAGILINVSQAGLLFTPNKMMPEWKHINPVSGIKRILSLQGVMRLAFGIFKIIIIAVIAFLAIRQQQDIIFGSSGMDIPLLARTIFDCLFQTCLWIAAD